MTRRKTSPPSAIHPPSSPGLVSLVGAGPGDPGLITVAGLERLRDADVIVYDRLAASALLDEAGASAERVYVGKEPSPPAPLPCAGEGGAPTSTPSATPHNQAAINRLLIEKARKGKRVVRLKGGDPFVFGRGGEEAEALRAAAIPFEIVPGVTSAVAVPAYAGIPVTHRGVASSFAVITGHEADDAMLPSPAHGRGARGEGSLPAADTLIFLMGAKTLPDIVDKLIANGRSPDTPVAVIRCGTTPEQQTVVGILADIVQRVQDAGFTPPAITVVGEVVRLRESLSWFEERPLFGKRVLITRTRKQASQLARLLAAEGAIPIELPTIEIEPTFDPAAVDAAVSALADGCYAWAVFTSANAVGLWFDLMRERNLDARAFGKTSVAAIGPATAAALAAQGIRADLIPTEYIAEAVVLTMLPHLRAVPLPARGEALESTSGATTARILLPRAESARPELVEGLRAAGAAVDEVTLYRAAVPREAPEEALNLLRDGAIDIVTFTSSSTVRNLAALLDGDLSALSATSPLSRASGEGPGVRVPLIACIGPITAATARELGLSVDLVAEKYTVEGLVKALVARLTQVVVVST